MKKIVGYMVIEDKNWAYIKKKEFSSEEEYKKFEVHVECLCGPVNVFSVHRSKKKAWEDTIYLRNAIQTC